MRLLALFTAALTLACSSVSFVPDDDIVIPPKDASSPKDAAKEAAPTIDAGIDVYDAKEEPPVFFGGYCLVDGGKYVCPFSPTIDGGQTSPGQYSVCKGLDCTTRSACQNWTPPCQQGSKCVLEPQNIQGWCK